MLKNELIVNEENFPGGYSNDGDITFVHFSKSEAKVYDQLQGGPQIEESEDMLPLRTYKKLGELLKHPDFVKLVESVIAESGPEGEPMDPSLQEAHAAGMQMIHENEPRWVPAPGDDIPEVKKIADKGRKPDTVLVYMPANVIYMLGTIRGGVVQLNPSTGYPEFGLFSGLTRAVSNIGREIGRVFRSNPVREVIRVGATIAGAVMGGPLGAAAGSTLGSAITGRKPKDWLGQAGKAAALTYGAQQFAPYIPGFGQAGAALGSSGIPGMAGLGNTMQGWAAPAAGSAGTTAAATQGGQNLPGWGKMISHTSSSGQNLINQAAPSFFESLKSSPLVQMAPHALSIASGFMANKAQKQAYENEKRARDDLIQEERRREEDLLNKAGFYDPLKHYETETAQVNPKFGEPGEPYLIYKGDYRYEEPKSKRYAKGGEVEIYSRAKIPLDKAGLIKGPGKGQADVIHTSAPEGSYIIPADVVSMLGDGSSKAGAESLRDYLDDRVESMHPDVKGMFKNGKRSNIPVALSRDEFYIEPHEVLAIGKGHHSEGVKMLDSFRSNVRKHKIANGHDLPPKAKSVKSYIGG